MLVVPKESHGIGVDALTGLRCSAELRYSGKYRRRGVPLGVEGALTALTDNSEFFLGHLEDV